MLKPEKARHELEKVRHAKGGKRRLAAVAKLPRKLAEISRGLLGRDLRGKPIGAEALRSQARETAAARLDRLGNREREALFEALFPCLGGHVDAAWEVAHQLPYATGFERKPFRAPHEPLLTRKARLDWLGQLLQELEGYEQDVCWLAAWAGYLSHGYSAEAAGLVLAGALGRGGREADAVFHILCDSAQGQHPVGSVGRHVTQALLVGSRPEGWDVVAQLLLASPNREGLRYTILESIAEAHPDAFRRLLRFLREHDLAQFPDTVRALNVWFGLQWDAVSLRVVNRVLERVSLFLEDSQAQARALESDDAETVYLALWTMAFEDAPAVVEPAAALLADPNVDRRFIAAHLLAQLQLPTGQEKLFAALDDPDLRVALCALEACEPGEERADSEPCSDPRLFEPLQRLLGRLPEKTTYLQAIIWPWHVFTADRQALAASLVTHLGKRPATALLPHLKDMEPGTRRTVIHLLAGLKKWDRATRAALVDLAGDDSITVRGAALTLLARGKLIEAQARRLEELLSRKHADLRRGVLNLLLGQKKKAARASAERLLAAPQPLQRQAGQELLRLLTEKNRGAG
jgi:hypothetical protein